MKCGSRPFRDFHAAGEIIRFRAGKNDTITCAVGSAVRLDQIHRGNTVAWQGYQKLQTIKKDESDQQGERNIETAGLRRATP